LALSWTAAAIAISPAAAVAQNQQTIGACSPVVSGVGGSAVVQISCPGLDSQAVAELNRTVERLLPTLDEQRDSLTTLIRENSGRSLREIGGLASIGARNLRETVRLHYKLDQPEILVSAALRFDVRKGVMARYRERIESLVEQQRGLRPDVSRWPSLWPFTAVQWRTPSDPWFPTASDGQALGFTTGFTVDVHCYSGEAPNREQVAVSTVSDLDRLPRPLFSQTVRLDPLRCGTALAVGEAFNEQNMLLRAERLPPVPGSVQRRASFTSAIDLLGGTCYAVVRNSMADRQPHNAVGEAMTSVVLLDLNLHITQNVSTRMSLNLRQQIQASERHQFIRWDLPQRINGFDRVMVANDFSPVPAPCPR
jgi:hypothetical protein